MVCAYVSQNIFRLTPYGTVKQGQERGYYGFGRERTEGVESQSKGKRKELERVMEGSNKLA